MINEQPADLCCDDTACPKKCFEATSEVNTDILPEQGWPHKKGPIRGVMVYKSLLECLLNGLCAISILQPVNGQQGGSRW